jgi:hypothetical protein
VRGCGRPNPRADEVNAPRAAVLKPHVRRGKANQAKDGYWIHGEPPRGTLRALVETIRILEPDEKPDPSGTIIFSSRPGIRPDQVEVARVLVHREWRDLQALGGGRLHCCSEDRRQEARTPAHRDRLSRQRASGPFARPTPPKRRLDLSPDGGIRLVREPLK